MKTIKSIFVAILIITSYTLTAQVSVSTDGSSADASAMLEVKSTNKGFLPPRMTETQRNAIVSPATGLMIYNTTSNSLDFFNATRWISITENGIIAQNYAPIASNLSISGAFEIDETLTGSYTYSDNESDPEGTSTFKWYRADDASGTNQTAISGATAITYELVVADVGKYTSFEVTPVANTGTSPGTPVMSSFGGPTSGPPEIGDYIYGGVVFYVDGNGGGMVCAVSDQGNGGWGCNGTLISGADGTAIGTGAQNTIDIVNGCSETGRAAYICANLSLNGYTDWFLPSENELAEIRNNRDVINTTASQHSGTDLSGNSYWSSTEIDGSNARRLSFWDGTWYTDGKWNNQLVRAVREF